MHVAGAVELLDQQPLERVLGGEQQVDYLLQDVKGLGAAQRDVDAGDGVALLVVAAGGQRELGALAGDDLEAQGVEEQLPLLDLGGVGGGWGGVGLVWGLSVIFVRGAAGGRFGG